MRKSARYHVLISLAALATACSDPMGPCDRRYACEVSGADIAVVDIRIIEGDQTGTDPVTNLPVYAPGVLKAVATVVNRGDTVSSGGHQLGHRTLPPLEPGEVVLDTLVSDFSRGLTRLDIGVDPRDADIRQFTRSVFSESPDADPTNDAATSPSFHVAFPVLSGTLSFGILTEIRAEEPFVATIRVDNVSLHGATLDSTSVVLCTIDLDVGCWFSWPYFGRHDLPSIAAGSHYENAYVATMPGAAMDYPDMATESFVALCLMPSSVTAPVIPSATNTCVTGEQITLRPDYEACDPPVLQVGVPVTLTAPNCGYYAGTATQGFIVAAVDAAAGVSYDVQPANSVFDADGVRASLTDVTAPGRYYVVFFGSPATATLTVEE